MTLSSKIDLILEWSRKHSKAIGRCLIIFFYYLIGIEYYHKVEGWNRTDCVYFVTVSITTVGKMKFGRHAIDKCNMLFLISVQKIMTVELLNFVFLPGYGHFVPTTDPARIFTVFYVLFGIGFVLTAALDFSKYAIVKFQDRLLIKLHTSENIIFKEMNKVGLCVLFLSIAILMGTCFFAVNENWSAAKAFYWTMMTMTVSLMYIFMYIRFHVKVLETLHTKG